MKKFEEGVFSDLRNLKPGVDACLEEPKVRATPFCFIFVISRLPEMRRLLHMLDAWWRNAHNLSRLIPIPSLSILLPLIQSTPT